MQDAASHVAAAARAEASRGTSKHCVVPIHAQILSAAIKKELEPCGGEESYTHEIRERVQVACRLHIHQTSCAAVAAIGPAGGSKEGLGHARGSHSIRLAGEGQEGHLRRREQVREGVVDDGRADVGGGSVAIRRREEGCLSAHAVSSYAYTAAEVDASKDGIVLGVLLARERDDAQLLLVVGAEARRVKRQVAWRRLAADIARPGRGNNVAPGR